MTTRSILQIFDQYQKARLNFVKSIAELALRPANIPVLDEQNILDLLKPLLSDVCKQIQNCATIALGRIIQNDHTMAKKFSQTELINLLLATLPKENKHQKNSILFVLRAVCKYDPQLAEFVVETGALKTVITCMEDFEPSVQESAAWVIGYIARHNQNLAKKCVEAGAVPLLIMCLQGPHLTLKQISASALCDIAKHSIELAQNIVDAGAIPYLAKNLNNLDEKLKRQVLAALSSCAKHSAELAEVVIEAEVFPCVFLHMAHACPHVRKNAAGLTRDVVKHTLELTQLIVNTGGIGALMELLTEDPGEARIPCITALGYIAGHSDQLAMSVLGCKAIVLLGAILNDSKDENVLAVTAWTIGQIGKHSPEHAKAVAAANLFPRLVQLYVSEETSEDLKFKCKLALKLCLQKCLLVAALEPLLYDAPPNILKYVLGQYSKILPHDPKARRLFVTTGGLKRMQYIEAQPGTTLMEYISIINSCFPEEIVRYYSPGYPETLLDKVEQYSPQMMTVLQESPSKNEETQVMLPHASPSEELENLLI
ncbi:sperm-associated antigen 6-like [Tribolium madens]|uniref:sperm-associated antigen 6-like n=1 Tax=Tribolium madens TaxID=41895 RepID=UPI001CF73847|nr:sperm-associated antigen 6-like [Tribolium madens]